MKRESVVDDEPRGLRLDLLSVGRAEVEPSECGVGVKFNLSFESGLRLVSECDRIVFHIDSFECVRKDGRCSASS